MNETIRHYDRLIDEKNDPVFDPPIMQEYMAKWDGDTFEKLLNLSEKDDVLEIGIGTGRLALKIAPKCKRLVGIDISPKTVKKAKSNLKKLKNIDLICSDFNEYNFKEKFDLVYSSLTFMHIEDKAFLIKKISSVLKLNGRVVISLDKNQDEYIDMGIFKTRIYPDNPDRIKSLLSQNKFENIKITETEFAYIVSGILRV